LSEGAEIHTPYGATESLPVATIGSAEVLMETAAATRAGHGTCVGTLAPDIELAVIPIVDDVIEEWAQVTPLHAGEIGEICVKGPVVTREYKFEPEQTRLSKIEHGDSWWHRMGDVGYIDAVGRLWFCGRKAHRVLCADGTVLFPVRCEGVFNAHPDVLRTALVGVSSEPTLIIERRKGANRDQTEILSELRALGAAHSETAGIDRFLFHGGFPVDVRHNAKIDRPELARWALGRG
jgi:acyl-CoA synthetase (AMP-forming)/AMP-acid ligase II